MIVIISNEQSDLSVDTSQIEKIATQVVKEEGITSNEVYIYLVDTLTICQLHKDYFEDPTPTDCISFPMDLDEGSEYAVLGEVFVCPKTAIRYANEHQMDPYEETTLYIVHGLLHLMGYDDIQDHDRQEMRMAEKRHMDKLRKSGLILVS